MEWKCNEPGEDSRLSTRQVNRMGIAARRRRMNNRSLITTGARKAHRSVAAAFSEPANYAVTRCPPLYRDAPLGFIRSRSLEMTEGDNGSARHSRFSAYPDWHNLSTSAVSGSLSVQLRSTPLPVPQPVTDLPA